MTASILTPNDKSALDQYLASAHGIHRSKDDSFTYFRSPYSYGQSYSSNHYYFFSSDHSSRESSKKSNKKDETVALAIIGAVTMLFIAIGYYAQYCSTTISNLLMHGTPRHEAEKILRRLLKSESKQDQKIAQAFGQVFAFDNHLTSSIKADIKANTTIAFSFLSCSGIFSFAALTADEKFLNLGIISSLAVGIFAAFYHLVGPRESDIKASYNLPLAIANARETLYPGLASRFFSGSWFFLAS